jgi:succinyl-CoA synthetase beta subunit
MKLLEYEAKEFLKTGGMSVPKSFIAGESAEFLPAILKSQVPVGGRGKAGGVVVVKTESEYAEAKTNIARLEIKGFTPKIVLAEELIDIARELYLSLLINKTAATIELMAHKRGGIEVEDNKASEFLQIVLDGKNTDVAGQQLADYYDLPGKTFVLQDIVEKLYKLFIAQDMTLLEINPLILSKTGELVAGDAKVVLDDAAQFRHADWSFEEKKAETNFVTLDESGNVATIANGAGLAMATVDAVADAGMQPANFLDIGGGANEASVLAAFRRIVEYPKIKVIIINIFAGITRCDEVAKAIITARSQITNLPPLAVRLAGTNYEQAAELLRAEGITIYANLDEAIAATKEIL